MAENDPSEKAHIKRSVIPPALRSLVFFFNFFAIFLAKIRIPCFFGRFSFLLRGFWEFSMGKWACFLLVWSSGCPRVLLALPIGFTNGLELRHIGFPNRSSNRAWRRPEKHVLPAHPAEARRLISFTFFTGKFGWEFARNFAGFFWSAKWGRAKGAAKASCGETVVQKGVFGESVSPLPL